MIDPARTTLRHPFAGRERTFRLTWDAIGQVERECHAGIGKVLYRLKVHEWGRTDIWSPIRCGLEGAGMSEPEATALLMNYQAAPLGDYLDLAVAIVEAAIHGIQKKSPSDQEPLTQSPSESPAI